MMDSMEVELLVIPDCPNDSSAAELLRTALREVGLTSVSVTHTVISTQGQADRRHFTGSPTILIDGIDPFPAAGSPAIACRMYWHPDGPSGIPELRPLRQALKQAAAHDLAASEAP